MAPILVAGLLALLTSACSTIDVDVRDGDAKPVQVGVVDSPSSSAAPTSPAETLPPGTRLESIDLGRNCPVTVELAVDDEWHDDGATDGFRLFLRSGGALLNINCSEESTDSIDDVVGDARKSAYSDPGSALEKEKLGTVPGGKTWSHLGELGPDALRAIDDEPTRYGGAVIGITAAGRTYAISIEIMVKDDDDANDALIARTLPTLTIDGTRVPAPRLG